MNESDAQNYMKQTENNSQLTAGVDKIWKRDSVEAEKGLKNAATPCCPPHAVVGNLAPTEMLLEMIVPSHDEFYT